MKRNILILILITGLLLSACGTASPVPVQATEPATATEIASTVEAASGSGSAPAGEPTQIPTPEKMTFTDDLGNTIELDGYPKSIVSISASTTEILFAVGAGDQVVGRDEYSTYPEAALNVPSVGAMWDELPTEAILALQPDLVIAAQIISEDQVQALRDLGLKVYWQANPTSYEGLWKNLRTIAQMTSHEAEAESLIADLDSRVTAVQTEVATVSSRPSTFYELDATDPSNPWTTGSGTFIDYIISQAGGNNAASALQGDYAQLSSEQLIAVNPDIILLADAMYGVTAESVAQRPGWDVINAVKNNAIYPIDPNMMSVPGPRLVNALEETAKILHPELFK
jgi:iron complex transport system substrate-binding protein